MEYWVQKVEQIIFDDFPLDPSIHHERKLHFVSTIPVFQLVSEAN